MNNVTRGEYSQAFSPTRKRKGKKLYAILFAISLVAALIAAVVLLARPSRTERFRRDLLEAIEGNDRQRYSDAMDSLIFNGNERMYDFRNKEEQLAVQEAQKLIFHIWLDDDRILWNDEELEKTTIASTVLRSGSPWGIGLAESEEGFELVKKALEKLEEKYPRPNSEMFIRREEGGTVIIGSRSYSHRTRP